MPDRTHHQRPPLSAAALTRAVVRPGGLWSHVEVVSETGSTNTDVVRRAEAGAGEGLVRIAETQHAGRGRLDRTWQAPERSALTMSVLVRPPVPIARLGWLPLLAGVALTEACAHVPGVDTALKWPNDLLVRPTGEADRWGKCAGILAETVRGGSADTMPPAVVVGIGVNVTQAADELPEPGNQLAYPPTSLALAGGSVDRERLAVDVLAAFAERYRRWVGALGDPVESGLREAYLSICVTLQRDVAVALPGGASVVGRASDIDNDGRLIVTTAAGPQVLAAGDVQHVR